MTETQKRIARLLKNGSFDPAKSVDSQLDLFNLECLVGMVESGEITWDNLEAVGGVALSAHIAKAMQNEDDRKPPKRMDQTMITNREDHGLAPRVEIPKARRYTINEVARVLAMLLNTETAVNVIEGLLSCEDDERLTDRQAIIGEDLFDDLCELCPEAIDAINKRARRPQG